MNNIFKGGLVDFKEKIIFEEYKDKAFENSSAFKKEIKDKYNYIASSDLYTRIINYQIKKYGRSISYSNATGVDFVENFTQKSPKNRKKGAERWRKFDEEVAFLEKVEKRNVSK